MVFQNSVRHGEICANKLEKLRLTRQSSFLLACLLKTTLCNSELNCFEFQVLSLKPRKIPAFLPRGRKRKHSLIELVPARKWIHSYVNSCSQIKNFIACMMMLLIRCTRDYKETWRIQYPTKFITWSRLVARPCSPPHPKEKRRDNVVNVQKTAKRYRMSSKRAWHTKPSQQLKCLL